MVFLSGGTGDRPVQEGASVLQLVDKSEIERRIPGFPIVLHGSSSIPPDAVETINRYGGNLKD